MERRSGRSLGPWLVLSERLGPVRDRHGAGGQEPERVRFRLTPQFQSAPETQPRACQPAQVAILNPSDSNSPRPLRSAEERLNRPARIGLWFAYLVLCWGLLEVGGRGALAVAGRPYQSSAAREELATLLSGLTEALPHAEATDPHTEERERGRGIQVHPFRGFEQARDLGGYHEQIEELITGRDAQDLWIFVCGGSVAGLFSEPGAAGARRLAERLKQAPALAGREPRIVQLGRGGYKQPQQLFHTAELLARGAKPDVVINLDGYNEVHSAASNRDAQVHPLFPAAPSWRAVSAPLTEEGAFERMFEARTLADRARAIGGAALKRRSYRSVVFGSIALERMRRLVARKGQLAALGASSEASKAALHGPPFEGTVADAIDLGVAAWKSHSLDLDCLCRARGVRYLHVLQPTLFDPAVTPVGEQDPSELAAWRFGVVRGYPKLAEAGAELAADGIAFLDARDALGERPHGMYYDACHFGDEGNERLAERIAEALIPLLEP